MNTVTPAKEAADFISPFENIALAFSGGGFRAASYGLGVLSYLNEVVITDLDGQPTNLLKKVTYLSSASGGSIATSTYALFSVKGKSFDAYYTMLYKALATDDLLQKVLTILNDLETWKARPTKTRNLINAFALAYDKHLFDGNTLQDLQPEHNRSNTHLQEICINATEFYRGLLFRQQIKLQPDSKDDTSFLYGNFVINLKHNAIQNLKLADLLAASSCFPGGFEPIIFPNDFAHKEFTSSYFIKALNVRLQSGGRDELKFLFGNLSEDQLIKNRNILMNDGSTSELIYERLPQIGFMDGGITDNMGLESMMRAHERRQQGETDFKPFDLMLVNDVGSHFMDPYRLPEINPKKLLSSWSITTWILITGVVLLVGAYGLSAIFKPHPSSLERVGIIGGSFLFTAAFIVLSIYIFIASKLLDNTNDNSTLNLNKNFAPGIIKTLLQYFTNSPIKVIVQMLKTRGASFLTLNSDVFLKRIRKLLYDRFYHEPEWKYRGKGNHVYDLTFSNNINRKSRNKNCPAYLEPSRAIQIVAENAFSMATTLWFDRARSKVTHKQACLVACGQFTTCHNLLEYIEKLEADEVVFNKLSTAYKHRVAQIKSQLMIDYEKFKVDPFFLYNKIGLRTMANFDVLKYTDIPFPENFKGLI